MISIVKATEEHLPGILGIGQEAISPSWTYSFLLTEFNKCDSQFFVAINNDVIGFVVLRQVGDDGEILQIAVDKSARRGGVGDLLMVAALDYSREREFGSVFLEVRKGNIAAICLYEKHGFELIRTRKDYYNNPIEDAIIMKREIK